MSRLRRDDNALPRLQRTKGSAKPSGPEYEFKLAGLLALRARREGLRFQIYTNVHAAQPMDDVVLRVLHPYSATVFVQLKHKNSTNASKKLGPADFTTGKGDFSLKKYFRFFEKYKEQHGKRRGGAGEQLYDCALDDVHLLLFTNHGLQRSRAAPGARPGDPGAPGATGRALRPELLKLFHTARGEHGVFGEADEQIWKLFEENPEENAAYRTDFLPRLQVFSDQVSSDGLDDLLREEIQIVFGDTNADQFLQKYLSVLRKWALDDDSDFCLSDSSGEVEQLLLEELRQRAKAAAGGGALVFEESRCASLSKLLARPRSRRGRPGRPWKALRLTVPGVPCGLRAAKLLQLLDSPVWKDAWVRVDAQALREFPAEVLQAACSSCRLLLLDVEEQEVAELEEPLNRLVASVGEGCQLVVFSSNPTEEHAVNVDNLEPVWEAPDDVWKLEDLTTEKQNNMMDRRLLFQGHKMQLRRLEGAWPGLRRHVDGATMAALVRGTAQMGQRAAVAGAAGRHLPRALRTEHSAELREDVLRLADASEHLVVAGFRQEELRSPEETQLGRGDIGALFCRWTVLKDADADKQREKFHEECLKRIDSNVHLIEKKDGRVLWRATMGSSEAIAQYVLPLNDQCHQPYQPTCCHSHDEAAGDERVFLLVGEPGIGKSAFLARTAAHAREEHPEHWVVLVELLRHRRLLRKMPDSKALTAEHALQLVAAAAGAAGAARRCLDDALRSGTAQVLVDGVDEVAPAHKDKVLQLLRLLLEEATLKRLCVASRPEVETSLRQVLKCTPRQLQPLSEQQQVDYLSSCWASDLKMRREDTRPFAEQTVQHFAASLHADPKRFSERAIKELIQHMAKTLPKKLKTVISSEDFKPLQDDIDRKTINFNKTQGIGTVIDIYIHLCERMIKGPLSDYVSETDIEEFHLQKKVFRNLSEIFDCCERRHSLLGLPLYLRMAAGAFREDVREAHATGCSNRTLFNGNINQAEICRVFMDKQREEFYEHHGHADANLENTQSEDNHKFRRIHQWYAMKLWTDTHPDVDGSQFKETPTEYKKYLSVEKTGILWQTEEDLPQFSHSVLFEYFVAEWLFENAKESREFVADVVRHLARENRADHRILKTENTALYTLDWMLSEGLPLHAAILENDVDALAAALEVGERVNRRDRAGRSALHLAAAYGRSYAVDKLLEWKSDIAQRDTLLQWTPLQYADYNLQLQIVERLLREGANQDDMTAIIDAVEENPFISCDIAGRDQVHIMKILLKSPVAEIFLKGVRRYSPFNELYEATSSLQSFKNYERPPHVHPIISSASKGNKETTEILLQAMIRARVAKKEFLETALLDAVENGHTEVMQLLLRYGADVNAKDARGRSAIAIAAFEGDVHTVKALLKANADVRSFYCSLAPLHCAVWTGQLAIARLLLDYDRTIVHLTDDKGYQALHLAATVGQKEMVQLLCSYGADINKTDDLGWTSLHYAAGLGHAAVAEILLEKGARFDLKAKGLTPLSYAIVGGHHDVIALLSNAS